MSSNVRVPREVFQRRRQALVDAMAQRGDDSVAVFPSAQIFARNSDVEHEYRQESDFFYLTGFDEPESVLVVSARERKTTLFVRPRDPEREIWDGPRAGIDGAKRDFGADEALLTADLESELPKLLANHRRVFYRVGKDRAFDDRLFQMIDRSRAKGRSATYWPTELIDPGTVLHEMRILKDDAEVASMKRAADITAEAHRRAMAATKPGMHEYEVEAVLLQTFRRHGAERPAYGSIVGSGPNATILHYRSNNRKMQDGELLLIDAGCEYDYLASDVTRTFPVNGTFTKEQKAIYEVVLDAQLASIAATVVGATLEEIHKKSVEAVVAGLVRLGLLVGDPETLIKEEAYRPFFMHRTSHWLGMDVHDVGAYFVDGKPRKLEAKMVISVEPGIYIGKDYDKVPAAWRGIGVRIEDDILVTASGPVTLTEGVPKTVAEVERACAAALPA
jgi:Xaa-Pro aminopeptidase